MRTTAALSILIAGGVFALTAAPALAQRARSVYPDEAVGAPDALLRIHELSEGGNAPEALRVLQKTLETEGDQFLNTADDKDSYLPVRTIIHRLLLASPDLLARYRLEQEPAAKALLDANRLSELEATHLLTTSGMEAVLRLAQLELEAARFESARLMLAQLEQHPDRAKGSPAAADAARLATSIAAYLPRPDTAAWAHRWATEAGIPEPAAPAQPPPIPPAAMARALSPLDPQPIPDLALVPGQPLQSIPTDLERLEEARSGQPVAEYKKRFADVAWIFPTLSEGTVYVNDGRRLSAWDAATLGERWQVFPSPQSENQRLPIVDDTGMEIFPTPNVRAGATIKEDAATVAVARGIVVGATGFTEAGNRRGDRRVHAIEAATGRTLWSLDPAWLHDRLATSIVTGPPVIEADTVILFLRDPGYQRHDTRLFAAGINLYTGGLKWLHLVGAMQNQQFFGRNPARPDAPVIHQGVVYRGDQIGVLCAYEAASGRPLWLRTCPPLKSIDIMQARPSEPSPPKDMCIPVPDGDSLFFVEFPRGRIVRIALADGRLLAKRDAGLGDPRYVLRAGDQLAAVGASRIVWVPAADFEKGTPHQFTPHSKADIIGRVAVVGAKLLVPVETGATILDPADPNAEARADVACPGNFLVAADTGGTHLLAADASRLHTYLRWEEAEERLKARVAERPADARPVLTYLELASRTGRTERVPDLADKALALLDARTESPDSAADRTRLYTLLLDVIRNSRAAWGEANPTPIVGAAQPVKDAKLLDQVSDRLSRTAESPGQQAAILFEKAWLREVQSDAPGAIEAYQQVLTDTGLSAVELDPGARLVAKDTDDSPNARAEATTRLITLIRRVGPAPYAAFDEEASRQLDGLAAAAGPQLAEMAHAYPVARAAPEAWNRASIAYAKAGDARAARLAAGAGLASAELGASLGRTDLDDVRSRLAGSLLAGCTQPIDLEPAYRLVQRLARQTPGLPLDWNGTRAAAPDIVRTLRARLDARPLLPLIGTEISRTVQLIDAWRPVEAIVKGTPESSRDSLLMVNETTRQVALWAVAAEDGTLQQLWTRPFEMRPIPLCINPDRALLFWPTPAGGIVESIDTTGAAQWKSAEIATLFPADAVPPIAERMPTPLDGPVRAGDLLIAADATTLALVQRRGLAVAYTIADGTVLWHQQLDLNRVYDVEHAGGCLVIGGVTQRGRVGAAVVALDLRTGAERSRLDASTMGDHARWMRRAGNDGVDMVVATAKGLIRYTPATGATAWNLPGAPGAGSFTGWVAGDGLFVLDGDSNLWRLSLADGTHASEPIETRERAIFPLTGTVVGDTLTLSSGKGLITYSHTGELIGIDSLDSAEGLEPPLPASSLFVTIESVMRDDLSQANSFTARLFMLAHPSGKLLRNTRIRLHENPSEFLLLDGKIILTDGPITLVLDAPPK